MAASERVNEGEASVCGPLKRHPGCGAMRSVAPQNRACPRLDRGNQSTPVKCDEISGSSRHRPTEIIIALMCWTVIRPRIESGATAERVAWGVTRGHGAWREVPALRSSIACCAASGIVCFEGC